MSHTLLCPPPRKPPEHTQVRKLGPCKVESPLARERFVPRDAQVAIYTSPKDIERQGDNIVSFEVAGPRKRIFFEPGKTRCAIVTCGGLCPGINDVIRSIVHEAHFNYKVAATIGIRYGLEGFIPKYRHDIMELTPEVVTNIHEFGGTILGSSRSPQEPEEIVDALERMNVNILFMIGGNGTMLAASALTREIEKRKLKIAIVGIPKTIDNDINFVGQTFGFDTAVEKTTEAIKSAHIEATGSPNGVGLVKIMGREAGFIAAQASLAQRDVDFVLIPEDPFELTGKNGFLAGLKRCVREQGHAVVVVAEGAGQHLLGQPKEVDESGNIKLGDIATLLKEEIRKSFHNSNLEYTLKYIDPSYIIRSVAANSNDCVFCSFLGQNALHAGMAGRTGVVISKWNDHYVHMPVCLMAEDAKKIDTCSNYWRTVTETTGQLRYFEG